MTTLAVLIPVALFLGALGLGTFLWTLRSHQYDDLDGAAERILIDAPIGDEGSPVRKSGNRDRPSASKASAMRLPDATQGGRLARPASLSGTTVEEEDKQP